MFSVIKNYKYFFIFSGVLVAGSLVLFFTWGLRVGIDFQGGTLAELEFEKMVESKDIQSELLTKGFYDVIVQSVSDKTVIIKTGLIHEGELADFKKTLIEKFGEYKELRYESIGPTISRELVHKAYWQIALVCLGILLYITYSFRKINKAAKKAKVSSWRLGLAAIIALIHDLVITVGFFVILGKFRGVEIDALFITALLTILGFSVHDTIVVFDRIRENLNLFPYKSLEVIIDHSINSTLARSINTTSTLIFVLIALALFGGSTIFNFVLALLVGVTIGTYSSIFIASPLLYVFGRHTEELLKKT